MSSMMIACPTTGRPVSTGIETEPAVFKRLPKVTSRLICPACGQEHIWTVASAWLCGEPQPLRLVPKPETAAA